MDEELFRVIANQLESCDKNSREEALQRLSIELSCIDFD